jgi:tartrate dehydratase alpha subunit/fumarate hydratase class I-like protein
MMSQVAAIEFDQFLPEAETMARLAQPHCQDTGRDQIDLGHEPQGVCFVANPADGDQRP